MTKKIDTSTFPSNGRVLVVGIDTKRIDPHHKRKMVSKDAWEIHRRSDIPKDVVAVVISGEVGSHNVDKIVGLAQESGIERIEANADLAILQELVKFWFEVQQTGDRARNALDAAEGGIRIRTNRIRPMKDQPRTHFGSAKMDELERSIRAVGQVMPIIVIRVEGDPIHDFELIEGERRLRACKNIGIPEMLAIVRQVSDREEQFKSSFVANFAREGHTPMETARGIERILTSSEFRNLSNREAVQGVAAIVGKHEVWVYQHLRLLKLPNGIQALLEPDEKGQSRIPMATAALLCTINDSGIQLQVAHEIINKGLSATKAKALAHRLAARAGITVGSPKRGPREDYKILRSLVRRTVDGAQELIDMPRELEDLFEHRVLQDRKDTIKEIKEAERLLKEIREKITIKVARRSAAG